MDENKLILYYYGELSSEDKRALETALDNDTELAARYRVLEQQMSGLVDDAVPTLRPHVTARWHDAIDRAARIESNASRTMGRGFNLLSFFWGAAITASLAVGIAIGVYVSGGSTTAPVLPDLVVDADPARPAARPAAFARGLQVHLRDSQRNISSLPVESADRALLIMDILEQNRLFERAAERRNSPRLARVLRAFEPILVRLAADDLAPEDAEALRAQLAFELNVMLTKIARETSEEPDTI